MVVVERRDVKPGKLCLRRIEAMDYTVAGYKGNEDRGKDCTSFYLLGATPLCIAIHVVSKSNSRTPDSDEE